MSDAANCDILCIVLLGLKCNSSLQTVYPAVGVYCWDNFVFLFFCVFAFFCFSLFFETFFSFAKSAKLWNTKNIEFRNINKVLHQGAKEKFSPKAPKFFFGPSPSPGALSPSGGPPEPKRGAPSSSPSLGPLEPKPGPPSSPSPGPPWRPTQEQIVLCQHTTRRRR